MKLLLCLLLSLDPLPKQFNGKDPLVRKHGAVVTAGQLDSDTRKFNKLYDKLTREYKRGRITKSQWQISLDKFQNSQLTKQ